jgi:hypothetical protein
MFHFLKLLLFVVLELRGNKVSSLDILKDIILENNLFLTINLFQDCQ